MTNVGNSSQQPSHYVIDVTKGTSTLVTQGTNTNTKQTMIADIQMQIAAFISLLIQYNLESKKSQFEGTLNEVKELIKAANTHLDAARIKFAAGCVTGGLQMLMGVAALHSASKMGANIKAESSHVTFKSNPGTSNQSSGVNSGTGTPNPSSGVNSGTGTPNPSSAVNSNAAKLQTSKAVKNSEPSKDLEHLKTASDKDLAELNKADDLQNSNANASQKVNSNKEDSIAEQNNRALEMKLQAAQNIVKGLSEIISSGLDYHSAQIDCDSEKQRAEAKKYSALASVDESTLRAIGDGMGALYQILQQLNNMEVAMNQTLTR